MLNSLKEMEGGKERRMVERERERERADAITTWPLDKSTVPSPHPLNFSHTLNISAESVLSAPFECVPLRARLVVVVEYRLGNSLICNIEVRGVGQGERTSWRHLHPYLS